MDLKIFCMTVKRLNVLDKLPSYVTPFGLGNFEYPKNWLTEQSGENIRDLNKFYGEVSGMYWLWKNYVNKINDHEWIGFCQHRRLWLDGLFDAKQKLNPGSLYSNLLKPNNDIFSSTEAILLQPTIITRQNLREQFDTLYGKNILNECLEFVDNDNKDDFKKYLEGNKMSICNMFITKPQIFNSYCGDMFNWIEKCFNYCNRKDLLKNENSRLPVFMVERFTSFWFEKHTQTKYLSFARLGNFFLSETVNKFINPLRIPLTFSMYPTIHKY